MSILLFLDGEIVGVLLTFTYVYVLTIVQFCKEQAFF